MGFRKGSNSLPRALRKASRGGGIELGPRPFPGVGQQHAATRRPEDTAEMPWEAGQLGWS